jgi:UDP-N-acetylmuramoyl-L-alanyl-D-glutamate--2,6-diaminopimelate ligase
MDENGPKSRPVTLRNVLGPVELVGAVDVEVRGCCCSPECVRPGDVFVALSDGGREDAVAAYQAVAKGAAAVVASAFLPELGVPLCLVGNPLAAYSALVHALAGRPSESLELIGCVGGRAALAAQVFLESMLGSEVGEAAAARLLVDIHDSRPQSLGRDPHYDGIAGWLTEVLNRGYETAVLAFPLEAAAAGWLGGLCFQVLCFESPGRPNSRGLRFRQEVSIQEEWTHLLNQLSPTGLAVFERGDSKTEGLLDWADVPTLTVGLDQRAEISATIVERSLGGQTLLVRAGGEAIVVDLRPIGEYAARGFLLAAAVALAEGISLPLVVRRAESVRILPGMLEPVCCGQPFAVLVDRPSSLEDVTGTLRELRRLTSGRLLCVCGLEGRESDGPRQIKLGSGPLLSTGVATKLRGYADLVFLHVNGTTPEDRKTFARKASLRRGFKEQLWLGAKPVHGCGQMYIFDHQQAAIAEALRVARPGDTVLIVSSHNLGLGEPRGGNILPAALDPGATAASPWEPKAKAA